MASYRDILKQVRDEIDEVDAHRAQELLASDAPPALIDVRERNEWDEGHIPGAVHVPRGFLESRIERPSPTATGRSSSTAPRAAAARRSPPGRSRELGYENVSSLAGGFTAGSTTAAPSTCRRRSTRPSAPATAATC